MDQRLRSNVQKYYRVLKPSGYSIMYDIHPFTRPFQGNIGEPKIVKSYNDIYANNHWRMQDLINAMSTAKLTIKQMEEMSAIDASFWFTYDELVTKSQEELLYVNDWKYNPMSALPVWLAICAQK